MSPIRWASLGVAAVAVVLTTAALIVEPMSQCVIAYSLAISSAVLMSATLWWLSGLYDRELTRLLTHLDGMDSDDWSPQPLHLRFGLGELLQQVNDRSASLRERVTGLVNRRRELEIRARLAEAERAHLEAILHSISDAVIVTDAFDEVAVANGAAGRILGFDADQANRRPIDQIVQDPFLLKLIKDTRCSEAVIRRHIEHAIPHETGEAIFDVRLASVTSRPTEGESASPSHGGAGVVTVLHDVTREKEIAEAKSDFVANVSHELRTPLSSIKAYMEMLIDGEAENDETRAEFYNVIQGEANRLSRLIDSILNISRIESGIVKVQREDIALPTIASEVVDILLPQANAKGLTLQLQPCPLFFEVFADRDMIQQVMLNLVGNAIKYTPENGRIDVRFDVDEHDRQVTFAVSDTGLGISQDDLPHIFDKFYRVADHKKAAKGTGLGLNLVKHVIESVHAGTVGVTSETGKGSTFTFTLPIAENG